MSSEWDCVLLEDIAELAGGHAFKSEEYTTEGHFVLRTVNITDDGRISRDGATFVSPASAQKYERFALKPLDTLFVMVGATLGKTGLVSAKDLPALLNQNMWVVRARDQKVDPLFLHYAFKTAARPLLGIASGSARGFVKRDDFRRMQISIPKFGDQVAISTILGALDDRITLLRETNATLEAIAQALFKSWFVDFDPVRAKAEGRQPEGMNATTAALFPDSFEESELGLVPKGWGVVPFLDACDLQGGAQPPAATFIDEPRDGYVRLLQIRDFSTDAHKTYIPDTGKLKKVTEDDVLIGRYGSASGDKAKDSLGRVCRGLSGSYNVALMKLCPVQVGREYAFQMVSDSSFYRYLQGVSSKAVQSGFSKAELGQYKVIMPSSDLAEAFEQFGKAVWERVKANRELAQTLTQLRDTLLPRLISGQLRLPEAQEQLEDALA